MKMYGSGDDSENLVTPSFLPLIATFVFPCLYARLNVRDFLLLLSAAWTAIRNGLIL